MSTNSKKHHYVPEAHLRNFARADNRDQIWVYDKLKSRYFSSAVRDVASEGNFNTIEVAGKKINLEPIFETVDSAAPPLIKKILETQRIDQLSQAERYSVATVVAVQIIRSKIYRLSFAYMMEQLGESVRNAGLNPEELANFGIPTEMQAKILSFDSLGSVDDLAREIGSKICVLHQFTGDPLWLSDNPVVMFNSFPYGDSGIKSQGIEIYYPISREFLLAFYCPSIGWKLRRASREALRGSEYYQFLLQGMIEGRAVESSAHLEFLNSLQVAQSHRFVFSSLEEFSLAEKMLHEHPEFSRVKGHGQVGPMGQVPRRERMPPGTHLVIVGELDHLMLPVASWRARPEGAEFEVTVLTSRIPHGLRNEESFQTVSVFEDGYEVRMIRGVSLEFEEHGDNCTIRARFSDEGLNSLSAAMKDQRSR